MKISSKLVCILFFFTSLIFHVFGQQLQMPDNPQSLLRLGQDQKEATRINEAIFQAIGFGNTFLVKTPAGNVIIDTSAAFNASLHKKLLTAISDAPIKYIILTHAHGDHAGGLNLWKQPGTQIIAQKNHVEFQHYQTRLNRFFALRNSAQFAFPTPPVGEWPGNYGAKIEPTILFDDKYEFELGGVKFQIFSTPGETPDHLSVWIPQYKAAFVGDNYYESFPNLYTLRGTEPRWALDYVRSLNTVMSWEPEIMLPSHGTVINGKSEIQKTLTKYRDAILYIHDETVKGMNAGKDVWTLMNEIKLPPQLEVGESYGKLSWSVRGIYEGYVGWFDLKPTTIYSIPQKAVFSDVVKLAGGVDAMAKLAQERINKGQAEEALYLIEMALQANPTHKPSLALQLKALEIQLEKCRNSNERGWLLYFVSETKKLLAREQ